MSAWGIKNFENDYAMDLCHEFEASKDKKVIINAIKVIDKEDDYLESPECSEALCAIEIVAAKIREEYSNIPDDISSVLNKRQGLFKRSISFTADDISASLRVIEKIIKDSELKELWQESDEFDDWLNIQKKLRDSLMV